MSIHAEETENDMKKEARVENIIKERMKGINSHYMRRAINLETQFPAQDDYRRCTEYLKKLCTEVVSFEKEKEKDHEEHEEHEEEKHCNTEDEPLPRPPRISLTGPMYHSHNISSIGVLKYAAEWARTRINTVFKTLEELKRPNPDKKLFEEETVFYSDGSPNTEEKDKCRRACPVLIVKDKEQALSPEFEKNVTKAPVTVISGAFKVFDIDTNLYSREEIAKVKPDEKIRVLNQVPQAADQNKSYE